MNSILREKGMMEVDYGVGVARGDIYVAKTGRKGANETRQDLVWVGYPTYLAVELSDKGRGSYHLWISSAMYAEIHKEDKGNSYNILYTDDEARSSVWHKETFTTTNGKEEVVYKTSVFFKLDLE